MLPGYHPCVPTCLKSSSGSLCASLSALVKALYLARVRVRARVGVGVGVGIRVRVGAHW